MFGRRFLGLALLALGVFALFGMIRGSAYRSGMSAGYYMAQQQNDGADEAGTTAAPNQPFNPGFHYGRGPGFGMGFGQSSSFGPGWGGSPFFWFLGALFKFWLFLLVIGLIGRFLFWGRHGRGPGGRWGRGHWRHHHHGRPNKYDDDYGDEPVMKA